MAVDPGAGGTGDNSSSGPGHGTNVWALTAFTAAAFVSAFLLFLVQPLYARMVLPVLGGGPSVWAVALFFFQSALLAGYLLAHALTKALPVARAGIVHLALFAIAALTLPIALPAYMGAPPAGDPSLWQLGVFAAGVGVPFVVLSANAPLLQAWLASSGHTAARDPYFLYAASNLGSLLALLGYPFILEPFFGVSALSRLWTAAYVVLAVLVALAFLIARRAPSGLIARRTPSGDEARRPADKTRKDDADDAQPTWRAAFGWVGLAFVPSALLTAFTNHISTDIAAVPLLWIMPLALYLLTFVLVFREQALIAQPVLSTAHLIAVVVALLTLAQIRYDNILWSIGTGVAAFFTAAMVAHRTLYLSRPPPRHLTAFYLWLALGGALGGMFAAVIAPRLFSEVYEYPLLIALSMACRPGALVPPRRMENVLGMFLGAACGVLALYWLPKLSLSYGWTFWDWGYTASIAAAFALAAVASFRSQPAQLLATLGICAAVALLPSTVRRGNAERSYFGVYRVQTTGDGMFRYLSHGTTLHGAERLIDDAGNQLPGPIPATYYHPLGPMSKVIAAVRAKVEAAGRSAGYAIVGLGAGSLACYAKPDERWRFFEIDPLVVKIARNPAHFSFLSVCRPKADIIVGDARLTLAKEPGGKFDLIIIDAFTSDAVPVHLLTAEALRLYLRKLAPGGIALLHISNQHLDLSAVAGATLATISGAAGVLLIDEEVAEDLSRSPSTVVLIAADDTVLKPYRTWPGSVALEAGLVRAWKDDHADIIVPFIRKLGQ